MFHEVGSLAYIMIIRRLDSSISSFELMSLPIALFIVVTESVTRGALVEGGGGGREGRSTSSLPRDPADPGHTAGTRPRAARSAGGRRRTES